MSSYTYGKNSVLALLEQNAGRVFKIMLSDSLGPDKRVTRIRELASEQGIAWQMVPRQKLDNLMEDPEAQHQGVVASVAPKKLMTLHELIEKCQAKQANGQFPFVLMLDGVEDPRNFGAILRVADAAGMDGVIIPKRHSAGFGPAVAKTAMGAEETVDVAVVSNLAQSLKTLKEAGFWAVATVMGAQAKPYYQHDYKMPTVLVMGGEGDGVSRLVAESCDFQATIPMFGHVESLNVATATAVLAFEIAKQQRQ